MLQIDDTQRKLIGVEAVIADTASLSVMLQTIGKPLNDDGEKVR